MKAKCPGCGREFSVRSRRRQVASNLFHKLNGAYARALAQDPAYTKVTLKYWHGSWVTYPFKGKVPPWPGAFVELFEGTPDHCLVYMKSESAYDKDEERQLIEGALGACIDVDADLSWMEERPTVGVTSD